MKKIQQILALAGVILILALYAFTLILALTGKPNTLPMLKASIYATIVVPALIWVYTFIFKLLKKYYSVPGTSEVSSEQKKDKSES